MVKHIILWKLKEEYNTESVKNVIKQGLEGLFGKIPGLLEIYVQTECLASSNADIMLDSSFESQEALNVYSLHKDHVFVADTYLRPYTQSRTCIDFEI